MGIEVLLQAFLSGEQVELSADDPPGFRVDVGRGFLVRRSQRAEAAILGRVANGLGREGVAVLGVREIPRGAKPVVTESRRAPLVGRPSVK